MRHFKCDISISQLITVFVEWIGIKTLVRIVRNVEKAAIFLVCNDCFLTQGLINLHIGKVGPEKQDFLWDPRPKTWKPSHS